MFTEIAHQLARHTAEKVSGFKVLMFASLALEVLGLDIGLTRAAVTLLLSLPNSRKLENEADEIGLQLMSKACFDPEEAQHLWAHVSFRGQVTGLVDRQSGGERAEHASSQLEQDREHEEVAASCQGDQGGEWVSCSGSSRRIPISDRSLCKTTS